MPARNAKILNALKCFLGVSEAPFCACIQCIHTCKLPSLFSGFRSKCMTYMGYIASELCSSHMR